MKPAVNRTFQWLLALSVVLALAVSAMAAQSVEVRMKDGSRWRGEIGENITVTYMQLGIEQVITGKLDRVEDTYIVVDGVVAGKAAKKLIYKGDVVTMAAATVDSAPKNAKAKSSGVESNSKDGEKPADRTGPDKGVFVLPLDGGVGQEFRHNEIEMLAEHCDKYGPGQIMVLVINSNGGLVLESDKINDAIRQAKKRHRVVAWIQKAISAGASTAMACDEIYFMTTGTCGSVTTVRGVDSVPEEEIVEHIQNFVDMAVENGYSEHIARAMKLNKYMCSYDKDPETGVVTFYGDKSGEYLLSDENSNLCFNAENAQHCGFSDGTADTGEDLARQLDLPRWFEQDDYGRRIAADWQRTVKKANEDIPRLITRLNYWKSGSGDPVEIIGGQISILNDLITWCDRAELLALFSFGLDKAALQREVEELRKQLADIKRAQNNQTRGR